MTDEERDVLAGEYVLGTLPSAERAAFEVRLLTDRPAADRVRWWERALASLAAMAAPEAPAAHVWAAILARIGPGKQVANDDRLTRWRAAALGLGALAASLGAWIVVRPPPAPIVVNRPIIVTRPIVINRPVVVSRPVVVAPQTNAPTPTVVTHPVIVNRPIVVTRPIVQAAATPTAPSYLAAINAKGAETALLLTLDPATGAVVAHPVKISAPSRRVLELWWIADGSAPRAVGLLDAAQPLRVRLDQPGKLDGGTFAVSVEHEGGSTTGAPTGKVVYSGKLVRLTS